MEINMTETSPYELMKIYTRSGKKINHFDRVTDLMVRGVHVITTSYEGINYGLSAAWAMRISGATYLIMTAVWHQSYTHAFIKKANFFAVNILAEGQVDLARHFGRQSGSEVDKFKRQDVYWEPRKTGAPILLDALAYLDCNLVDAYDPPGGDHTLYIGEMVDGDQLNEGIALQFNRVDYPYRVLNIQE
jgi:flavin reductase (DIM6/NTAB) family NADH-FMN oxidoreductase RutF